MSTGLLIVVFFIAGLVIGGLYAVYKAKQNPKS